MFFEFRKNINGLNKIAEQIKNTISNPDVAVQLYRIGDEEDDEIQGVKEGRVIYKLHKYRERDPKLNKKKKEKYFKKYGKLDCEVCKFDFYEVYGQLGEGVMECHHKVPLSEIAGETITSIKDLALVCANCHRMLHRKIDTLSIEELRNLIKNGG